MKRISSKTRGRKQKRKGTKTRKSRRLSGGDMWGLGNTSYRNEMQSQRDALCGQKGFVSCKVSKCCKHENGKCRGKSEYELRNSGVNESQCRA